MHYYACIRETPCITLLHAACRGSAWRFHLYDLLFAAAPAGAKDLTAGHRDSTERGPRPPGDAAGRRDRPGPCRHDGAPVTSAQKRRGPVALGAMATRLLEMSPAADSYAQIRRMPQGECPDSSLGEVHPSAQPKKIPFRRGDSRDCLGRQACLRSCIHQHPTNNEAMTSQTRT